MPLSTAVVGRQAIADRHGGTIGYELLFRRLPHSTQAFTDGEPRLSGDQMTIAVFFGALGVGLGRLTGGKPAFVNADRNMLTDRLPVALPASHTVVEVLESVAVDSEVLDGCRALRESGYRLAADDFAWFDGAERLLDLVSYVKIDIQAQTHADVEMLARRCRSFDVQLLAEKVETEDELEWCRELGFDLFQGYHIARPQTVVGTALNPEQHNVVRLANAVLADYADFTVIEDILRVEPALTYQLLQLASLGRFGETQRPVRSIREGLVLMGLTRLRSWVPALMLRPEGRAIDSGLVTVLTRARTAELLAIRRDAQWASYAFAAAMISGFDLLLGMPRSEVLAALDIPQELQADAFGHGTPLARLINDVRAYEEGRTGPPESDWDVTDIDGVSALAFSWALDAVELIDAFDAFDAA